MRNEILALLEEGPYQAAELAAWLNADRLDVIHALKQLHKEGLTWRTDRAGRTIWTLTGAKPTPPVGATLVKGKAKSKHRKTDEFPGTASLPKDQAPSWWCGLDRMTLNSQAQARAKEMSKSKHGQAMNPKPLPW